LPIISTIGLDLDALQPFALKICGQDLRPRFALKTCTDYADCAIDVSHADVAKW
jgi:hypothetical protein